MNGARRPGQAIAHINRGSLLRKAIEREGIVPLIGVYDTFSASIAGRHFDGLFVSGFSFAASYYGLPDVGFIAWSDIVAFVQRLRAILPEHHIVVDIDDGYCDTNVACHVAHLLETLGASAVILEDQQRPRRCGHLEGKQIMELDPYLEKLGQVIAGREDMMVIARTDASDEQEAVRRAVAFAEAGADAVLIEAVRNLDLLSELKHKLSVPVVYNQIAGGKSPLANLRELHAAGVSLVNYSTPCLFSAQAAMEAGMRELIERNGCLTAADMGGVELTACNRLLHENVDGIALPRK